MSGMFWCVFTINMDWQFHRGQVNSGIVHLDLIVQDTLFIEQGFIEALHG